GEVNCASTVTERTPVPVCPTSWTTTYRGRKDVPSASSKVLHQWADPGVSRHRAAGPCPGSFDGAPTDPPVCTSACAPGARERRIGRTESRRERRCSRIRRRRAAANGGIVACCRYSPLGLRLSSVRKASWTRRANRPTASGNRCCSIRPVFEGGGSNGGKSARCSTREAKSQGSRDG